MTIKECIDLVDIIKPNQYSIEEKVRWLSYLDHTIINDVIKTHAGYDGRYEEFEGYTADRLGDRLIVESPHDRLYEAYLKMKIDEENGETARYNNSATMFNSYLLEYKKHYNKHHMPIHHAGRRPAHVCKFPSDVTAAQMENLRKEILSQLREDITEFLSEDKIYDVIMKYVSIHRAEFVGKDGAQGKDGAPGKEGKDGVNGKSAYEYAKSAGYTGTEEEFARKLALGSSARIADVTLYAEQWVGEGNQYSQIVQIAGVTENSQVDLTPSVEQLETFYRKDITFVTENMDGVITVYVIGQKPENDYIIQATITEVTYG